MTLLKDCGAKPHYLSYGLDLNTPCYTLDMEYYHRWAFIERVLYKHLDKIDTGSLKGIKAHLTVILLRDYVNPEELSDPCLYPSLKLDVEHVIQDIAVHYGIEPPIDLDKQSEALA